MGNVEEKQQDSWIGRRLIVTAGPTHEPIDAVRFIGNRSSGRLGVAMAEAAGQLGAQVRFLSGPGVATPGSTGILCERFTTAQDLGKLLETYQPWAEVVIMAAAVADFTPKIGSADLGDKWRRERGASGPITLELVATQDLLAACAARRMAGRQAAASWAQGQVLIGFALEPRERLIESARAKLARKGVDAIVANPLETMESDRIEATVYFHGGQEARAALQPKRDFAVWLLDQLAPLVRG